jgi:hypothetical protein
MPRTVADQFAESLIAVGFRRVYGIIGDSLDGLTDAIRHQDKIEWLHVRHERVTAFTAGTYVNQKRFIPQIGNSSPRPGPKPSKSAYRPICNRRQPARTYLSRDPIRPAYRCAVVSPVVDLLPSHWL